MSSQAEPTRPGYRRPTSTVLPIRKRIGSAAATRIAPHLRSHRSASRLLIWYFVATLPLALAGLWRSEDTSERLGAWLSLLGVSLAAALLWEGVFARYKSVPVDPTWFTAAWLFALLLPGSTPLWLAGVAISFGLLIGHHIFGGLGRTLVHPALLGVLFVHFGYPSVGAVADFGPVSSDGYWPGHFVSHPGATLASASALACLGGALVLVRTGAASWRTLLGGLLGTALAGGLGNVLAETGSLAAQPWYWHLVVGNLAFGIVFLATDPSTAALTRPGRWFHGLVAGSLTVLIRLMDPAHPDGALFAILLAGLSVPVMDYLVVRLHVARRERRILSHGR